MPLTILLLIEPPEEREHIQHLLQQELTLQDLPPLFHVAPNWSEGCELLQQTQVDLVISSILEPTADACSFFEAVRQQAQGQDLPALVLIRSAKERSLGEQLHRELGVTMLESPFSPPSLTNLVTQLLESFGQQHPERIVKWLPGRRDTPFAQQIHEIALSLSSPFQGTLDQYPFAWLLVQAAAAEASGSFKLARGKVRKIVYCLHGRPVFVDSNLRNETLGAYMIAMGLLDEEQLALVLREARSSGTKLGEALIALGYADEQTVLSMLEGQVQLKLASAIRWPYGEFAWLPGDAFSHHVVQCPVDPVELALIALKRYLPAEGLDECFAPYLEQAFQLTALGKHYKENIDRAFGPNFQAQIFSGHNLQHILSQPELDLPGIVVQMKAMLITGLAQFELPATDEELIMEDAATPLEHADADFLGLPSPRSAAEVTTPPLPTVRVKSAQVQPGIPDPTTDTGQGKSVHTAAEITVPPPDPLQRAIELEEVPDLQAKAGEKPVSTEPPPTPATSPSQPPLPPPAKLASLPPAVPAEKRAQRPTQTSLKPIGPGKPSAAPSPTTAIPATGREGETAKPLLGLQDLDPTSSQPNSSLLELTLLDPEGQKPPLHAEPEDSGVLVVPEVREIDIEVSSKISEIPLAAPTLEKGPRPHAAATAPLESTSAEEVSRLKEFFFKAYLNIHDKNYYEILEIDANANQAEIEHAYRKRLERFAPTRFQDVKLGSDSEKLAELNAMFNQAYTVLTEPDQRLSYDQELSQAQPTAEPDAFGAELYFQEGQTLLRQNAFADAVNAFRQAVETNQVQPDYHAFLGWALFLAKGRGAAGAMAARPHITQALRIAPDSVQSYELAGRIEKDARDYRRAADHLGRALTLGPPRLDLFDTLKELLNQLGEYGELEQYYRQVIFRLREKDPQKTVPLWIDLAQLYLSRLGQPENARVAVQVAGKLAPHNPQISALLNQVGVASSDEWPTVVEGYRQRWRANPRDLTPLHSLFSLHLSGKRPEHALTVATILVYLGAAAEEEQKIVQQLSPQKLAREARTIDTVMAEQVRLEQDKPFVEEVLATLSPLLVELQPKKLSDWGCNEDAEVDAATFSPAFREAATHVAATLGITLPQIYQSATLGCEAIPWPMEIEVLIVGAELLQADDPFRIAFYLARALSCLPKGRRHLLVRPVAELKDPILATLSFGKPDIKPADPTGTIARFREALEEADLDPSHLTALVGKLLAEPKINLSQWKRAVRQTSTRIGLYVCQNLLTALQAVATDPEVVRDLMDFALSDVYIKLTRRPEK